MRSPLLIPVPVHSDNSPTCGTGASGTTKVELARRMKLPSAVGPELNALPIAASAPAATRARAKAVAMCEGGIDYE